MDFKDYMKAARQTPEKGDKTEYMTLRDKMMSNVFINAQRNSAPVCSVYDADVTALCEALDRLRGQCDYRLTLNAVMLKILVEGLKAAPRLNAHYYYNHLATAGRLVIKKDINVSMAICKKDGETFQMKLMRLQDKSLKEIALVAESARERLETADLSEAMFEVSRQRILGEISKGRLITPWIQAITASVGKGKVIYLSETLKSDFLKLTGKKPFEPNCGIKVEELNEGTVCFTNWGAICPDTNLNIVSGPLLYPQVFLFSVGRLREEKYAYEDAEGNVRIGTKKILPLGLNFDHKIGGAYELMPFIKKLDEIFESPEVMCEW